MKFNYQVGIGPATRSVEYTDQFGKILFTFDPGGATIVLELDLEYDDERYVIAANAARDFLSKRMRADVDFWPEGPLAERCKRVVLD